MTGASCPNCAAPVLLGASRCQNCGAGSVGSGRRVVTGAVNTAARSSGSSNPVPPAAQAGPTKPPRGSQNSGRGQGTTSTSGSTAAARGVPQSQANGSSSSSASGSASTPPTRKGPLHGTVSGPVELSSVERSGGSGVLLALLLFLVVGLATYGMIREVARSYGIAVLVLCGLALFFEPPRRLVGGLFRLLSGSTKAATGIVTSTGARVAQPRGTAFLEVRRFRVTDQQRRSVDCVIEGELRGATLRHGDDVELTGRFDRAGVMRVRRVRLVGSGAVIRPSVPASIRRLQATRIATVAVCVVMASIVAWFVK
jgi:hypothetical protein